MVVVWPQEKVVIVDMALFVSEGDWCVGGDSGRVGVAAWSWVVCDLVC